MALYSHFFEAPSPHTKIHNGLCIQNSNASHPTQFQNSYHTQFLQLTLHSRSEWNNIFAQVGQKVFSTVSTSSMLCTGLFLQLWQQSLVWLLSPTALFPRARRILVHARRCTGKCARKNCRCSRWLQSFMGHRTSRSRMSTEVIRVLLRWLVELNADP